MSDWHEYQEKAAEFFRSLGYQADTDVAVKGARTSHDIDVLVRMPHSGFDVTWAVECKLWNSKVSKLHVIALRQIVIDIGADRGIILAENGYQSGAFEAAKLTNVQLTSLAQLEEATVDHVFSLRLREQFDRLDDAHSRYWDIPKSVRIEFGLRPDCADIGYSANAVIKILDEKIKLAFRDRFPIGILDFEQFYAKGMPSKINSIRELVSVIEPIISDLEGRIAQCETAHKSKL